MSRSHLTEFPDWTIPVEIQRLVAAGTLKDTSWHNDATPTFEICPTASLWVDHACPSVREMMGKRFWVALYDEAGQFLGTAVETESLDEVMEYLADHWEIRL